MKVRQVSIAEWQEFVDALPLSSFFQSPAWALAHVRTYPGMNPAARLFTFYDGTDVLVPLIETRRLFWKSYYSAMNGYGGFLAKESLEPAKFEDISAYLTHGALYAGVCPHPLSSVTFPFALTRFQPELTFTHVLDVNRPDVLYSRFSHACRKNISRAQRENLRLTVGTVDDVPAYYKIYLTSAQRHGEAITPQALFANLLLIGKDNAKLLFVEKDRMKIAGVIMLYGKGESFQWHAAALYEYENMRPANFWEWEVIKRAYDYGYKIHDFGSSEGMDGVKSFKESFGPRRVDYSRYSYRSPIVRALGK